MLISIILSLLFCTTTTFSSEGSSIGSGSDSSDGNIMSDRNSDIHQSSLKNNNNNNNDRADMYISSGTIILGSGGSSSTAPLLSPSSSQINSDSTPPPLVSRVVHTKHGAVSGVIVHIDAKHLDPVEVYKGIPYASPPTGSLRFMPPVTGALWSGVKKADKFGPTCPQRLPDIANETAALQRMSRGRLEYLKRLIPYLKNQSEDCLYLNIYAPIQVGSRDSGASSSSNNEQNRKLPVMVFVHGESYEWNSGNPYDGSVLASFGQILVVTINYRLGILGFLNANIDKHLKLPANYGLMDIIAALHWIKENIAAFGGDPQSITLAGHGTGAACVHFLMSSSAVPEGLLFNRAILMSGSGFAPWSLVGNPAKYAAIISHHVNCSPDLPYTELMKCLRDVPLDHLLSAPIRQPEFGFAFGPTIDGVVIDTGDLSLMNALANTPSSSSHGYTQVRNRQQSQPLQYFYSNTISLINAVLMRKSAINKLSRYDLIAGITRAEAFLTFNSEDVQYGIEADRRSKILKNFVRNTYVYHLNEIFATIVNEYIDWERPVQHPVNIRDETLEALSDAQYIAPTALTIDLHSADHRNSYLYVFDYQTKFSDFPQRQGCVHGEDLPYVFGAPLVGGFNHFTRNYTKSEISLSEMVMLYWSNFIKSGNPNEQDGDSHRGSRHERTRYKTIEWTAYETVHKKYLSFDTKLKLKNHYRAHRLSFWLNLIPDLHKPGGDNIPESHHQLEDDDLSHLSAEPTFKPLNPPKHDDYPSSLSNFSIFTTQVFSLLNFSSPASSLHKVNTTRSKTFDERSSDIGMSDNSQYSTASPQEDGFAAYSTALSVTIAIGCSLLILNVLIFAGVYYQRDKTRLNEHHDHKKCNENGQISSNICMDLETLRIRSKNEIGHHTMQHHQLPPPEFADIPQRAPPPPKHLKTLPEEQMLSSHGLQVIGKQCGTLTKKGCMKQPTVQQQQSTISTSNQQSNMIDELRV